MTVERALLFPLVLGLADGILNALTLASSTVLHGRGLTADLALKVGAAAVVSAVFTVFVAEYAQRRAELAHAEYQLNSSHPGQLAAGNLGRQVRREALAAAAIAGGASFTGSVLPLLTGVWLSNVSWIALVLSIGALGVLGVALAARVHGSKLVWAAALAVAGVVVTVIGVQIALV